MGIPISDWILVEESSSLRQKAPVFVLAQRERRLPRRSLPLRRRRASSTHGPALEVRPGTPAKPEMDFSYVYILQSQTNAERFYIGLTDGLKDRLRRHNSGQVSHTTEFRPWRIKTAVAFTDRARASEFERYLKTPGGPRCPPST